MKYAILPGCQHPELIRELFSEYTAMLVRLNPKFRESLDEQNYDREIDHLEEKYGEPWGRLHLVMDQDQPIACIGLYRFNDEAVELKRLYVRPAWRGRGLAGELVDLVLEEAYAIGYKRILLDTLPDLDAAIRLYEKKGFRRIDKYNGNPVESTIYMEKIIR